MKKSIFGAGLMVLAALLLIAPTAVKEGPSPTPGAAPASSTPPVPPSSSPNASAPSGTIPIAIDSVGDNIGMLLSNPVPIPGDQNNVQIVVRPPTANKSLVYYPVSSGNSTPTPAQVTLKVPRTLMVAYCPGADSYIKTIGQCANARPVSRIIPISLLSDPAAQTPGVSCSPPKAPTYDPIMGAWNCVMLPGSH